MTKPSAPKKDNTAVSKPVHVPTADQIADSPIVNNPAEGNPDIKKLPEFDGSKPLPAPSTPVRKTVTLENGTVREDR